MNFAPILVFVYNRPDHTQNLLNSLKRCKYFKKSKVFIFSDFYKPGNTLDKFNVLNVRKIIKEFSKIYKIKIIYNKENKGLYENIINGIDFAFKRYSKAIILEDDLILHFNFLEFINKALKFYENKENIYQISGYSYPLGIISNKTYFLPLVSCWGWATWKKKWLEKKFLSNKNLQKKFFFLKKNKNLIKKFNFDNSYNYFNLFKSHINNKKKTWGILFYLKHFFNDRLCVYPPFTLSQNRGFDGSGQNNKLQSDFLFSTFRKKNIKIFMNSNIQQNEDINRIIVNFFKKNFCIKSKIKYYYKLILKKYA